MPQSNIVDNSNQQITSQYSAQTQTVDASAPNTYMYGTIHTSQQYNTDQNSIYSSNLDSQKIYQNIPQYQANQPIPTQDMSQAYTQQNYPQYNTQYNQPDNTDSTQSASSQYASTYPYYNNQTAVNQNYSVNSETSQYYNPIQNVNETQNYNQSYTQPVNQITTQPQIPAANQTQIPSATQSSIPTHTPIQPQPTQQKPTPKNSNIDLLLGIDFLTNPTDTIPVDVLQPAPLKPRDASSDILIPTPAPSIIDSKPQNDIKQPEIQPQLQSQQIQLPKSIISNETNDRIRDFILSTSVSTDRKSSIDNLSIISDLSSSDQNYDWDSASAKNDETSIKSNRDNNLNVILMKYKNPFDDQKILKHFHKEIERLEKLIETLNVKNLNGITQLDGKWKELQDLLVSYLI